MAQDAAWRAMVLSGAVGTVQMDWRDVAAWVRPENGEALANLLRTEAPPNPYRRESPDVPDPGYPGHYPQADAPKRKGPSWPD